MSLNKLTATQKGLDLGLDIGCTTLECKSMIVDTLTMPVGGDLDAHNITISNSLTVTAPATVDIGGNNYITPDLGQPNYSLHTDGAGSTFWSPDDTGSGDITYAGIPPTVVGQLVRFSSLDGKLANQSAIVDDGVTLDLAGQSIVNVSTVDGIDLPILDGIVADNTSKINDLATDKLNRSGNQPMTGALDMGGFAITNVGVVDTVDVSAFKSDYDAKVDQSVKALSSPGFISATLQGALYSDLIFETSPGLGVTVDGVLIKDGNVDGVDVSVLGATVATHTSDIASLSNSKLDKVSSIDLNIVSGLPRVILKDNVSIGGSNGCFALHDSSDTQIGCLKATAGVLELSRLGVPQISMDAAVTTLSNSVRINGLLTIGSGAAGYDLPVDSTGASNEDILVYNAGTKALEFAPISTSIAIRKEMSTGVFTGGLLSINADNTKYNISDGTGQIVDPNTGIITPVAWSGKTALSTVYAGILTYVSLDAATNPVYRTTKPTNAQRRQEVFLGVLVHTNGTNINAVNNEQSAIHAGTSQTHDLMKAIGFVNADGNVPTHSALLKVKKTAGTMFGRGINYANDVYNPHELALPLIDTSSGGTFQYRYRDGSSSALTLTDIIPGEYDDGNGQSNPGAVPNNNWTIQRFYSFASNALKIQPGQTLYATKSLALSALPTEMFVTEPSIVANGMLIGYLVVKGNATDLTDPDQATFLSAGKLGGISGSGSVFDQSLNTIDDVSFKTVTSDFSYYGPDASITAKGPIVRLLSDAAIPIHSVLTIANVGGQARASMVKAVAADDTAVIGIAASGTTAAGQSIDVQIGGIWQAILQDGVTSNIGDPIEKSDVTDGRVIAAAVSVGTFGIALTAGTGNAAGTVLVTGMFRNNENF